MRDLCTPASRCVLPAEIRGRQRGQLITQRTNSRFELSERHTGSKGGHLTEQFCRLQLEEV